MCLLSDDSNNSDRPEDDDDDDDDDSMRRTDYRQLSSHTAERAEEAELAATYLCLPGQTTDVIGQWEQHTRVSHVHYTQTAFYKL